MTDTDLVLVKLDYARNALAEAKTIQETKNVLDIAVAAETFAKRQKLGEEAIHYATSIKIEALRQLGEMLQSTPRNTGVRLDGKDMFGGTKLEPPSDLPTLADMGLDKKTSKLAQDIASLPDEVIEKVKRGAASIHAVQQSISRQNRIENTPTTPDGKYNVIYADPPWKYDFGFDIHGAADRHYHTLSIDELCDLPIPELVENNAVLFLWVTSPKLFDAHKLIKAWGFDYKTSFVWDKVKHVMGHYNSVRHEFLLVCVKGSFPKQSNTLHDSVITIERSDEHSEKPEYFRTLIEDMYPLSKKIELFARKSITGWESWGNEL